MIQRKPDCQSWKQKYGNVLCDWFVLPLLLPTPIIWFSLDHKRNVSDGVVSRVNGRNGNILVLPTLRFRPAYDSTYDSHFLLATKVISTLTTPTPTPSLVKTCLKHLIIIKTVVF